MFSIRRTILRPAALTALIGSALVAGSDAANAGPFFSGDPITSTGYSGWAGAVSYADAPTMPEGGPSSLYGFAWYEDGNQPCRIGTYWRTLTQGTEVYTNSAFDHCSGSPGNRKAVIFADNPRYFVRGIATCSSKVDKNEHRVKGVKIYAAKVWMTKPDVEALTTVQLDDHANCGTWNAAVFCPAGQVAVGLVIHREDRSMTGLGLRCRPVHFD